MQRTETEVRMALAGLDEFMELIAHRVRTAQAESNEDSEETEGNVDLMKDMMMAQEALRWVAGDESGFPKLMEVWKHLQAGLAMVEAERLRLLASVGIQILPTGGVQ
jgi:hypothetical protein